jgi:hypothetical protein
MAECDECGAYENLPYQCRRCGQTFCADHRLPENHDCPGLGDWNDPAGVFDSGFDDGVENRGGRARASGVVDSLTGTGGLMGYFRGNMTYVFLGLMWVTFGLQLLVGQVFGSEAMASLFVLRPNHLEYVWTWVTAVFAHGGFGHIAMNSIVLYFFGPTVERYIGSARYTVLFVVAGALAGLAQVAGAFLTGDLLFGVVGASGAIMAIMGLLTVLNPSLRVYLYFIIPMPLWVLTFGFAAFSFVAGFGTIGGGNVAHVAHLAGLFVGLAYGARVKGRQRVPSRLEFGGGSGGLGGGGRGRM